MLVVCARELDSVRRATGDGVAFAQTTERVGQLPELRREIFWYAGME